MIFRAVVVFILFAAFSLLAFGLVIDGELITVDDPDQMARIAERSKWNLEKTFVRRHETGLYYRPLITLSFTADKLLWNADTRAMHGVNIFLHTVNALLVVLLTRILIVSQRYCWLFSILGGIFFLWHPLTTESVNWLSGRTDILAATFVLTSALSFLRYRANKHWPWLVLSIALSFAGVLAKETAIAFWAGLGFLAWSQRRPEQLTAKRFVRRIFLLIGSLLTLVGVTYFIMYQLRDLVLGDNSSRIGLTLRIIYSDLSYAFFVCLRALGFYFKKIFIPWPLNFAIIEVDPLYELLALPLLLLLIYLFTKRSMAGSYALTAAVLISPSFVIAFNQLAWTPYAERYVYISLCFVAPILALGLFRLSSMPRLCSILSLAIVFSSFFVTLHRGWQWSSNELLWADTVKKSPLSEKAWNNYGVALMQLGRYSEAEKNFDVADNLKNSSNFFGYNDKYRINMAVALIELHEYEGAIKSLLKAIERSNGCSSRALDVLIELITEFEGDVVLTIESLREKLQFLADETGKAGFFYQLGRLEISQNNMELAQGYLKRAFIEAKESDPVRKKIIKDLTRLKS